jgi:hypothetical protein
VGSRSEGFDKVIVLGKKGFKILILISLEKKTRRLFRKDCLSIKTSDLGRGSEGFQKELFSWIGRFQSYGKVKTKKDCCSFCWQKLYNRKNHPHGIL